MSVAMATQFHILVTVVFRRHKLNASSFIEVIVKSIRRSLRLQNIKKLMLMIIMIRLKKYI
jgi:hypothetical protein